MAACLQTDGERFPDVRLIVDDEDLEVRARGRPSVLGIHDQAFFESKDKGLPNEKQIRTRTMAGSGRGRTAKP
jgi:hypothetical protein